MKSSSNAVAALMNHHISAHFSNNHTHSPGVNTRLHVSIRFHVLFHQDGPTQTQYTA